VEISGKIAVLIQFVEQWTQKESGNKVLVFSQTKKALDIIEKVLSVKHLRMDGNVTLGRRMQLIDQFNKDPEVPLFLLTTKVGGIGINLTAANKVVIFDPDWNPMVDVQATERALRIG